MNEPNLPKDITHFVFTDYSGDDGRKFDRGSSATLTLAIAISHRDDYAFNEDLVFQVKRLLGIKASDELKFTTLKRHKKRSKALRILEQAKIQLCIIHVLKKLEPDDDPMSIIVANTFPMTAVASEILRQDENSKIQVVFDQTQSGMWDRFIRDMLSRKTEFQGADIRPGISKALPMLQLTDICAGLFRDFLEGLGDRVPCTLCLARANPPLCSFKRKGGLFPGRSMIRPWMDKLLQNPTHGYRHIVGYYCLPTKFNNRYRYLDCVLYGK
jgi:hypothetical protein